MSLKQGKWLTLKEIEGKISPHDEYVRRELGLRKEALEYVDNITELAHYIGGTIVKLGMGENWAIKKEAFPGVGIFFLYRRADKEFPSNFRALYSGDKVIRMRGDDLASLTIACANHMLRYVIEANPGKTLPKICDKV